MKTFEYRGYELSGAARRGMIEATDLKEARELLTRNGVLPERVEPVGAEEHGVFRVDRTQFQASQRAVFYHELGVLIESGLPLMNALEVLMQSPDRGRALPVLAAVRDRVREGATLEGALGAACRRIQPFERAIVAAGERSGALTATLEKLAGFMEAQERLRERIQSALIYPAIIVSFAVLVAIVMLGFVLPATGRMLTVEMQVPMPLLTRGMMALGRIMAWAGVPVLLLVIGGVWWLRRRRNNDPLFRRRLDQLVFRLPVIGRGYTLLVNVRFTRTFAILLQGGVPAVQALPLAGRATGSAWIEQDLERETEAVRHGGTLADAVRRVSPLAGFLPGWIQSGEASGALVRLLETAGNAMEYRWDRFVTRALSLLEPVLILLVGGLVLLIVLSVLLPIIALNRSLG